MKNQIKIVEPVYVTKGKRSGYRLFFVVSFNKSYGLFSVPLEKEGVQPTTLGKWGFRFYRSKGKLKLKLNKQIDLFKGQLVTPEPWKPVSVRCSISQIYNIKLWVEFLNKVTGEL